MSNLSKTAAIREAQRACGRPIRRSSTDYVCYVPYYDTDISGPSTELQADSYPKLVAYRARKVAHIALELMGACASEDERIDAECAMDRACQWGSISARELVDAALDAMKKS